MTTLWTGKGDDGTTGLLFGGRTGKSSPRIEAVVRTHRDDEPTALEMDILGKVFMGEHELAVSMTRYVLDRYGADPTRAKV